MKKLLFATILFIFSLSISYGQAVDFHKVKQVFESFEHSKVIRYSDELLKNSNLSDSLLVEVYLMRAVSFYALGDETNSKNNFSNILKIKKDYTPDPSTISPKLIAIFNDIKSDFIKIEKSAEVNKIQNTGPQSNNDGGEVFRKNTLLNLALPGYGRIISGQTTKGIIISALSTAVLASMIYYISETNKKETDYLNSISENSFQQKYNAYNNSYKIRNTLIISYAAIWLFSQLDLLIFSDNDVNTINKDGGPVSVKLQNPHNNLELNIRFPF